MLGSQHPEILWLLPGWFVDFVISSKSNTDNLPAFSSLSSLILALFPILIIKDLQLEMRLKVALVVVMSMGIVATAASIVKTVEIRNLATPDFTYNATTLVYWFISENWLIILAASIPTIGPLYFVLLGKRTAESFAAPSKPGRSTSSWWKQRSFWSAGSHNSGQSRTSAMEKGCIPSPSLIPSSYESAQSIDEQNRSSETELVGPGIRMSSNAILKTTRTEFTTTYI